ncbi:orotate phosphoribosyltransferase [Spiroplasma sp. SV19]|uniref:orotate phosphoribosyltransferase n=1 Tax=Spiroplasma sp. SV19 TaxID=2570468 RepID=UPI0024B7176E|nr:orotate phosphoribosyltransferase [Spiroplasma sp. SV19]WHQ36382.1 orotate phosphoribosyltransferase [Spiroplasma sp. SV19]
MKKIITELVNIKAININTTTLYTWASGIKSPVYIDNRLIMGYPQLRWAIAQEFAHIIHSKLAGIKIENIFGTATAGIPHATLLGHLLQLPFGYVRSSKKGHGKQNQIEGVYQHGQRVIVIEDLISTGGSVLEVVKTLQQAGMEVVAVLAIFSYQLQKAITKFNRLQIPLYILTNFDTLIANTDILTSEQQIMLQQFHEQLNQ